MKWIVILIIAFVLVWNAVDITVLQSRADRQDARIGALYARVDSLR